MTEQEKIDLVNICRECLTKRTLPVMMQEISEQMCAHYCKYPDIWDTEAAGYELCESDICKSCPMNLLT